MAIFGNLDVRLDPWQVEYGSELPAESPDAVAPEVDLDVERPASEWRPIAPGAVEQAPELLFVDGVRRIEARLLARRSLALCHGAFGSFGVGAVRVGQGRSRFGAIGTGQRRAQRRATERRAAPRTMVEREARPTTSRRLRKPADALAAFQRAVAAKLQQEMKARRTERAPATEPAPPAQSGARRGPWG